MSCSDNVIEFIVKNGQYNNGQIDKNEPSRHGEFVISHLDARIGPIFSKVIAKAVIDKLRQKGLTSKQRREVLIAQVESSSLPDHSGWDKKIKHLLTPALCRRLV